MNTLGKIDVLYVSPASACSQHVLIFGVFPASRAYKMVLIKGKSVTSARLSTSTLRFRTNGGGDEYFS